MKKILEILSNLGQKLHLHHAIALYIFWLLFIRFVLIFSFSIDLEGMEFIFAHNCQLVYQNISLYQNPDAFPFYAVMYNPLYYDVISIFAKIFKVNPIYEIHRIFIISRAINFIMILISLRVLYKTMMQFNLSKKFIYILLLCFLLLFTGHFYATRPDGMKITFYVIQLYAIIQYFYFNVAKKKYIAIILILNVLSFLLKQDAIVYSGVLLVALMLSKRNKKSIALFISCFTLVIISYIGCIVSKGDFFFMNTFMYNFQNATDLENSYNLSMIYGSLVRLFLLLIICVYSTWYFRKKIIADSLEYFLGLAAIPIFFIAHLFMLKSGGFLNYSYELIVVLIILTARFLSAYSFTTKIEKRILFAFGFYIFLLISSNKPSYVYSFQREHDIPYKSIYEENYATASEIKKIIQNDTFFLANGSMLIFYSDCKNIFYGYEAHIDRLIHLIYGQKESARLLFSTPTKVDNSFKDGTVKYIVIDDNQRSAEHMLKHYPNYSKYRTVRKFNVYKYNSSN